MGDKKTTVNVKTIKVPIITQEDGSKIPSIDYAACEVKKVEEENIEGWGALPELAKKVSQFNQRQAKYLETDTSKDYILMKIIIK